MSDCDILFKYSCILSPTCGHSRLLCTHLCTVAGSSVTCMLRFSTVDSQSMTISTFAIHLLITLSFVNAFVCACCCMDSPVGVVTWAEGNTSTCKMPTKHWRSSAGIHLHVLYYWACIVLQGMSETRVVHFPCYATIFISMHAGHWSDSLLHPGVCVHACTYTRLYIRCGLTCL